MSPLAISTEIFSTPPPYVNPQPPNPGPFGPHTSRVCENAPPPAFCRLAPFEILAALMRTIKLLLTIICQFGICLNFFQMRYLSSWREITIRVKLINIPFFPPYLSATKGNILNNRRVW